MLKSVPGAANGLVTGNADQTFKTVLLRVPVYVTVVVRVLYPLNSVKPIV